MAEQRSLVGRMVRWAGRAVWAWVSTSGDLDTGPVRSDRRADRPPRRSGPGPGDDPRNHHYF